MPIEIRQLIIRSTVDSGPPGAQGQGWPTKSLEQMREEILAECQAIVEEKLQQLRER